MLPPDVIEGAFLDACRAELTAIKPGNVHVHASGHDMVVAQFEHAAEAAAPFVAAVELGVGERIRRAVEASMDAAGCNTNLGILLLCAPLAKAATLPLVGRRGQGSGESRHPETRRPPLPASPTKGEAKRWPRLRSSLAAVLDSLDVSDAAEVFRAISAANPGGLGRAAEADVAGPATMSLRQAMALAADRDRIAKAYVDVCEDIFGFALPVLALARAGLPTSELAVTALHMRLLAAFPDSHIARKYGMAIADNVRSEAAEFVHLIQPTLATGAVDELLRFDRSLKERRLNPGTTADFVVATLFAEQLDSRLRSAKNAT